PTSTSGATTDKTSAANDAGTNENTNGGAARPGGLEVKTPDDQTSGSPPDSRRGSKIA
ncbi:unnamed protein product, partial [Amoebophrya sp. A25]